MGGIFELQGDGPYYGLYGDKRLGRFCYWAWPGETAFPRSIEIRYPNAIVTDSVNVAYAVNDLKGVYWFFF